jgi:hypothetical protein
MKYILLLLAVIASSAYAKEVQYVCEFTKKVQVTDYSTSPKPEVTNIKEKFTFFADGQNSSYINLNFGQKNPAIVIDDGLKITFIEKNTGTDLFLVTIFLNANGKKPMGAIMSMHSYGDKPKFYNPYQEYGTCY